MGGKKKKPIENPVVATTGNGFGNVLQWTMRTFISGLILYFAYSVAQQVAKAIVLNIRARNVPEHKRLIIHQLSEIAFYVVMVVGIFVALVNLGVQTASIVTLMGTMMVTIGLALQSTLTNIFSGVSVALADNFRIGDTIRVFLPWMREPVVGRVEDLNIAYVMLRENQTGKILYIPNTTMSSNVFINLSRSRVISQI